MTIFASITLQCDKCGRRAETLGELRQIGSAHLEFGNITLPHGWKMAAGNSPYCPECPAHYGGSGRDYSWKDQVPHCLDERWQVLVDGLLNAGWGMGQVHMALGRCCELAQKWTNRDRGFESPFYSVTPRYLGTFSPPGFIEWLLEGVAEAQS